MEIFGDDSTLWSRLKLGGKEVVEELRPLFLGAGVDSRLRDQAVEQNHVLVLVDCDEESLRNKESEISDFETSTKV